jgi:5'-nucleotidase
MRNDTHSPGTADMPLDTTSPLVVGLAARTLFDLRPEDEILRGRGPDALRRHQREHAGEPLAPGPGLAVARSLLTLDAGPVRHVELVLLSDDFADASLRLLASARHHGLDVARAVFSGGRPLDGYLQAFGVDAWLSADEAEVAQASAAGRLGGLVRTTPEEAKSELRPLRIVFEVGDRSPEGSGDDARTEEGARAGALGRLARALAALQPEGELREPPLRTALVAAGTGAGREHAVERLADLGLRLDEAFFLGGAPRAAVLAAFQPHLLLALPSETGSGQSEGPERRHREPEDAEETERTSGLSSPLGRLRLR